MLIVILTMVLVFPSLHLNATFSQENKVSIIFRNSLGQYYSTDLYQTLINDLEKAGVSVSSYNASDSLPTIDNLTAYDILVIPNPGTGFSDEELSLIKKFLESGGNLIIMGDIQYDDRHYGKPNELNSLLSSIGLSNKVMFWGTNDNGDEIKDDSSNVGSRNWQISVSSKYFNPHIISVGIEKVVVNSPSLIVSDPNIIVATTPPSSYAEDTQGNIHKRGQIPWLVAIETSGGKVVVCGGSRIFSDATLYGMGTNYISYGDNEKLFFNIVWWITGEKISAPVRVVVYYDLLDYIGIIVGILVAHLFKLKSKEVLLYALLAGVIFALIGIVQVLVIGETVIGTFGSGWGYVATSLGSQMGIDAWAIAGMRFFLAGLVLVAVGAAIYWLIIKIDEYLKLGIREKLSSVNKNNS